MNTSSIATRALSRTLDLLLPLFAVLLALLVGVFLLLALGANPFAAYYALFNGALGNVSGITQALTKATPLLLVGVGICIAFRGGVINIGGEGQIIVGAIAATALSLALRTWPGWLLLPLTLAAGALAGAVEVTGVHHRMLEGLSGGYGFSGIVAALFGKLHPLGAIPASFLFGALLVGADKMQRTVQVPNALIVVLNGLVVLFVVASELYARRRSRQRVEG